MRGDDVTTWNAERAAGGDLNAQAAVTEAERIFAQTRAAGGTAFVVTKGEPARRIDAFDLEALEIIMIPRVVGG